MVGDRLVLGVGQGLEDVICYIYMRIGWSIDTYSDAFEGVGAEVVDDAFEAIVSSVSSSVFEFDRGSGEVDIVMYDYDMFGCNLEICREGLYRYS